ncbi:TetR/AcrR family transcriptional regulator [Amycolatopsis sp. NPDC059657]|uniref:TetR/AcrR family transcriptional regulator n=1 Tax=Amycolatopsis sp. NPDC059657 TaxID=3346899 RepID=UPI00366E5402
MKAESGTPLRADARRNRDQIIAAAKTIFVEQGPDAPMEDIARAAAVGVGTLYRRFPDRETLIREVARDNFARVLTEARAAIAEEDTSWGALVRFLRFSQELRLSVQLAMLSPQAEAAIHNDPLTAEFRRALLGELEIVVKGAQEEGELRADVGAGDVALVFTLLLRQLPNKLDSIECAAERVMALMLDGLRARPGSALPGRVLTGEDLLP